jgi:AraC-like DNA-binding protein
MPSLDNYRVWAEQHARSYERRLPDHGFVRPRPPLDGLIEFLWAADDYVAVTPRERVLPSGSLSIVFHMGSAPVRLAERADPAELTAFGGAVVCGARTTPIELDTSALRATVGIQFKPGGARPFLDLHADELAEQIVPLDALWGNAAANLRQQLLEAPTITERLQRLERFLLQRARGPLELSPALRASLAAFEEPDLSSVATVSERTGLSARRLIALFRDGVGLSPKAFWRVRRFRGALHDLEHTGLRGATLAAAHGYCDQAHFLREFRALTGLCPTEYLNVRVPGTDHVSVYR